MNHKTGKEQLREGRKGNRVYSNDLSMTSRCREKNPWPGLWGPLTPRDTRSQAQGHAICMCWRRATAAISGSSPHADSTTRFSVTRRDDVGESSKRPCHWSTLSHRVWTQSEKWWIHGTEAARAKGGSPKALPLRCSRIPMSFLRRAIYTSWGQSEQSLGGLRRPWTESSIPAS